MVAATFKRSFFRPERPGRTRLETDDSAHAVQPNLVGGFTRGQGNEILDLLTHRQLRFRRKQHAPRTQVARFSSLTDNCGTAADELDRQAKLKALGFSLICLRHYKLKSSGV
jgi:hypothetical protein